MLLALAPIAPLATGTAAAAPAGMATIPDDAISEDVPSGASLSLSASELRGDGVMASKHADSLEVVLTTADHADTVMDSDSAAVSGDGMALVLRDDVHSEGRRVAIDAGKLKQALGYTPNAIYGTHEDGSTWTASADYRDGYLVFDVPHFSDNTVTFSGSVDVGLSSATNGTSAHWSLSDYDSASNVSVTATGSTNAQWDNVSATGVSDGESISLSVSGNAPPTGPSNSNEPTVSFTGITTGVKYSYADSSTSNLTLVTGGGDVIDTQSKTQGNRKSVGGVADWDRDDEIEAVRWHPNENGIEIVNESGGVELSEGYASAGGFGDLDDDGSIETVTFVGMSGGDLYMVEQDGSTTSLGPSVSDVWGSAPEAGPIADLDADGDNETAFMGEGGWIKMVESDGTVTNTSVSASDLGSASNVDDDGFAEVAIIKSGTIQMVDKDGETQSTGVSASTVGGTADFDRDGTGEILFTDSNDNLKYTDIAGNVTDTGRQAVAAGYDGPWSRTDSPSIDVDDDGASDASVSGTLADGETVTKPVSLDTTDDTATVSVGSGAVDIDVALKERTQTVDPAVELNGNTKALHSGTLSDGFTADTTISKSNLQEGENTLNVSLDDSTISADAPAMQADIGLHHNASDKMSVNYTASTFEEEYNISHTYADATGDATVTVPFASDRVVDVTGVEYQINESGWSSVSSANYRLDGTTLDVFVSDEHGGSLPSGATVDVRATGRKISVANGTVTVTDPTKPGEDLETELKIDSRDDGFRVNVGPTENGERVHYAHSDDYRTNDYAVIEANGDQELYLPDSKPGDAVRVTHLDTRVIAEQGDVRVAVASTGENPELDISPGPGGSGDPVKIEYYNTESGSKYLLESLTRSIVVDSDVAESPAIFTDDDSDETWRILKDTGLTTNSSSTGPIGQFRETASSTVGSISLPISGAGIGQLALLGALAAGAFVAFGGLSDGGSSTSSSSRSSRSSGSSSGGVSRLAGGLVSIGGTAARSTGRGVTVVLRNSLSWLGELVSAILSNRRASIVAGIGLAMLAARVGLIQLPEGTGILIVVSGVPLATWLIMRRSGSVSRQVWLASTLAAVGLGLEFVAPGTIQTAIEQLTSEQVAPLLILVGAAAIYLWYRARKADRPQIIIGGND